MYFNGLRVPMFIGESQNSEAKAGNCRLEIRNPTYMQDGNLVWSFRDIHTARFSRVKNRWMAQLEKYLCQFEQDTWVKAL